MDFISILIASIILCFFLGNYFHKYEEESKDNYLGLRVYISSLLMMLILVGTLSLNKIILIISLICFFLVLLQEIIVSIKKMKEFSKDKKGYGAYMCSVISIRGIIYLFGAPLLVLEHLLYLMLKKISK
jgi:hypothetical protein